MKVKYLENGTYLLYFKTTVLELTEKEFLELYASMIEAYTSSI